MLQEYLLVLVNMVKHVLLSDYQHAYSSSLTPLGLWVLSTRQLLVYWVLKHSEHLVSRVCGFEVHRFAKSGKKWRFFPRT